MLSEPEEFFLQSEPVMLLSQYRQEGLDSENGNHDDNRDKHEIANDKRVSG
jgi:hypothetical protein